MLVLTIVLIQIYSLEIGYLIQTKTPEFLILQLILSFRLKDLMKNILKNDRLYLLTNKKEIREILFYFINGKTFSDLFKLLKFFRLPYLLIPIAKSQMPFND